MNISTRSSAQCLSFWDLLSWSGSKSKKSFSCSCSCTPWGKHDCCCCWWMVTFNSFPVLILVSSIWHVASEPADDAASSSQFPISNPLHCPGPEAESWSLKPPNSDSTASHWKLQKQNWRLKELYQKARSNSCRNFFCNNCKKTKYSLYQDARSNSCCKCF
jgi:hypothetical protein